jgi:hypothetical protein
MIKLAYILPLLVLCSCTANLVNLSKSELVKQLDAQAKMEQAIEASGQKMSSQNTTQIHPPLLSRPSQNFCEVVVPPSHTVVLRKLSLEELVDRTRTNPASIITLVIEPASTNAPGLNDMPHRGRL